jgi:hypothetical protein
MRFILIDPKKKIVDFIEGKELTAVYAQAGLKIGEVDHGTIFVNDEGSGIAIVVYELGLFKPPQESSYFALFENLYEGGAILYAFDEHGETIDIPDTKPPVLFFRDGDAVERAILSGEIRRPRTAVNGETIWEWPKK